ncbi:FIT family protein CG10671 [Lingula anatina]|uniref:FIT family protein CG10671 n=1 Tax=Lingula anatina TaxID=7574 RepID=A0A1S3H2R7_LINAN|nr:FIT family protein CG10671 [Lingula anatina]|eukprot:XP_013380308.1 FIT family protein CG10671 [Lingula anatina]
MATNRRSVPAGAFRKDGKKSLPGPTNVQAVISAMINNTCKRYLFIDTSAKIGAYLIIVCVGSLICDLFRPPRMYLADKNSILNKFFVRVGWGWTCAMLGLFIFFTMYISCGGDRRKIGRHMSRLAVGTFWWYIWTNVFEIVEHQSGFCSMKDLTDKRTCYRGGHIWIGFDISGHAFLLIHNLLMISEEVKCLKSWDKVRLVIQSEGDETSPYRLDGDTLQKVKEGHLQYNYIVKGMTVVLTMLTLLWEVMLVITTLYYHTIAQKVVGAFIAIGCWFVSYQMWYLSDYSPKLPGEGTINTR